MVLYCTAIDQVVLVSSMREAETMKLLENTFRAVIIGIQYVLSDLVAS